MTGLMRASMISSTTTKIKNKLINGMLLEISNYAGTQISTYFIQ